MKAVSLPHPRELRESQEFYARWSPQVFTFCQLLCGDQHRAELCAEQAFLLFFRSDFAHLDNYSEIPIALLRFAAEIAEIRCQTTIGTEVNSRSRALLTLPFSNRAAFILISVLGLRHSVAAIALGLSREQVRQLWLDSALRLRGAWLDPDGLRDRSC